MTQSQIWRAFAPSNIALIKYAGKKDKTNIPINASLSYTLHHLKSVVEIEPLPHKNTEDLWEPVITPFPLELSSLSIKRFLHFFQFLKEHFNVTGNFRIRSGNYFPGACGVASSASSFCALTKASYQMAQDLSSLKMKYSLSELSALSRCGSGSSCRSFFSPWVLWKEDCASLLKLEPFPVLIHQLILSDQKQKPVSSSEAHQRLTTSPYFLGRTERVQKRLDRLLTSLKKAQWNDCFQIVWEEFEDLHQLYETSSLPIVYRTDKTYKILTIVKDFWKKKGSGPLVTMDAGSSVHLLYRMDQKTLSQQLAKRLSGEFQMISSHPD